MNSRTIALPQWIKCLALATLACLPNPASGAVIIVPNPSFSIQAAINTASPGDTILVGPGIYNEQLILTAKQLFLMSQNGAASTTINARGNGTVIAMSGNGSRIEGFTVTGGREAFGAGINISGGSLSSIIRNNIFENNIQTAGGFGAAIGGNSSSPLIDENIFRGNSSDFQFLSGVVSFVNVSSPLISNNLFYDNQSLAINLSLPSEARPLVINNTIDGNTVGIYVDRRVNSVNYVIRNNIITNNGTGLTATFGTDADNPTFANNLVFGNTTNYANFAVQTGLNGNISADPLFSNVVANDFHLTSLSPAIDAGSAVAAPDHDFSGSSRPLDGNADGLVRFDIGAFERVPEPSITLMTLAGLGVLWQRSCARR